MKLIPERFKALDKSSKLDARTSPSGKYLDLVAFYKGEWHYITSFEKEEDPAPAPRLTPDATTSIPQEVIDAANLLHNHFAKQGITEWELGHVASRSLVKK